MNRERESKRESPIFIVGLPRSGTTLMRFMLCAHPRICIAPETNYLNRWMRFYSHLDITRRKQFEAFWEDFAKVELFPSFGISPDSTLARIEASDARDHRTVFSCICSEYAAKMEKARWGEKTPKHEQYLDVLMGWFPGARVLFLLRDPRAVAASLLSKDWGGSFVHAHAERWRKSSVRAGRWAADERVSVISYERLVREPERALREICRFLREDFVPEMIDRSDVSRYVLYPDRPESQRSIPVLRPLNPEGIDRWRSKLSRRDVAVIEHVAREEMEKRGYRAEGGGLRAADRGLLLLDKLRAPLESLGREPFGRVMRARLRTYLKSLGS